MQYVLSLLPLLACPLGMGLLMWLMMRLGKEKEQTPTETHSMPMRVQEPARPMPDAPDAQPPSLLRALVDCVQMCLNWKVLVGLALIAVAIWVVAPQFALAALPVLLVLACPLSMLFMMSRMRRGTGSSAPAPCQGCETPLSQEERLAQLKNEREALTAQIAEMEQAERPSRSVSAEEPYRSKRLHF